MVTIEKVINKRQRKAFIRLAYDIYRSDPAWVPPLILEMKAKLSPKHPFREYGEMELFLAKIGNKVVGRIAAILNPKYNDHHAPPDTGFFGFFECTNDQEVANALFDTAKEWLQSKGVTVIQGPASPSSNYDFGFQTSGFEHPPVVMSVHTAPYYEQLALTYGFKKIKTLYAYKFKTDEVVKNPKIERVAKLALERSGIRLRYVEFKKFKEELAAVKRIYDKAWQPNWGHVPFSDKEFELLGNDLKMIADKSFIIIGEKDGRVVGVAVAVRDFNYIFKQMNGRLLPLNWLKLFTQRKNINWARVIILGIDPEYQRRGLDAAFYYELYKSAKAFGIEYGEGSWVLEDNTMMRRGLEAANGKIYKEYGVYEIKI